MCQQGPFFLRVRPTYGNFIGTLYSENCLRWLHHNPSGNPTRLGGEVVTAFTRGGMSQHHQWNLPFLAVIFIHDVSWVVIINTTVPSPDAAEFIGFAAQAKPVRLGSAEASTLYTLTFGFNPGDAKSLIGTGVLTTPPSVGPFCRSVGAQSTTQP